MLGRAGQACQLERDVVGVPCTLRTCCSRIERAMPSTKRNFQKKKHGADVLVYYGSTDSNLVDRMIG
jgi:hypothetical protein